MIFLSLDGILKVLFSLSCAKNNLPFSRNSFFSVFLWRSRINLVFKYLTTEKALKDLHRTGKLQLD